jgi:hypothetical protein
VSEPSSKKGVQCPGFSILNQESRGTVQNPVIDKKPLNGIKTFLEQSPCFLTPSSYKLKWLGRFPDIPDNLFADFFLTDRREVRTRNAFTKNVSCRSDVCQQAYTSNGETGGEGRMKVIILLSNI